jgi:hypothetical protein
MGMWTFKPKRFAALSVSMDTLDPVSKSNRTGLPLISACSQMRSSLRPTLIPHKSPAISQRPRTMGERFLMAGLCKSQGARQGHAGVAGDDSFHSRFGWSNSINAAAMRERSFWLWAVFQLGHRPLRACSLAKTSPKDQKSSLLIATSFLSML